MLNRFKQCHEGVGTLVYLASGQLKTCNCPELVKQVKASWDFTMAIGVSGTVYHVTDTSCRAFPSIVARAVGTNTSYCAVVTVENEVLRCKPQGAIEQRIQAPSECGTIQDIACTEQIIVVVDGNNKLFSCPKEGGSGVLKPCAFSVPSGERVLQLSGAQAYADLL